MKKTLFLVLMLVLITSQASSVSWYNGGAAVDWGSPEAIGGTTPATGAFTTLSVSGSASPGVDFYDTTAAATGTSTYTVDALTASQDSQHIFKVDDSAGENTTYFTIDGSAEQLTSTKPVVAPIIAYTPQSLTVTTEANITLTSSLLLLTGDNDGDNDAIDLQNGTVTGQVLTIVGIALIDGNDTITVAMTDTTCTGCLAVVLDEIGDTWGLVWTGATWATVSNSEVP